MRLIFTSFLLFTVLVLYTQSVGINNISPEKPLHIRGSNELLRLQGSHPWIGFMNETDTDYKSYLYQNHTTNTLELGSVSGSNISMALSPNGTRLLHATSNQRIGIGTSIPQTKLHINSNESEVLRLQSPAPTMTYFNSNGDYRAFSGLFGNSLTIGTTGGSDFSLKFMPNGQNKMSIMPDGSVSVNSESPHSTAILDINSGGKGLGLPIVTTFQKETLQFPREGLLLYDSDQKQINLFTDGTWKILTAVNPWHTSPVNKFDYIPLFGTTVKYSSQKILVTGNVLGSSTPNLGVRIYNEYNPSPSSDYYADAPSVSNGFGLSSDILGDIVLIGAPKTTVSGHVNAGAVYVYRIPSTNGALELIATIQSTNPQPNDEFGHCVHLRSITTNQYEIYIGVPYKDFGGLTDNGLVGRYLLTGNALTFQNNIFPDVTDRGNNHNFGYSLEPIGPTVIVGAPGFNDNNGAVFAHENTGTQLTKLENQGTGTNNYFGTMISSYGNNVAISSRYYNANSTGRVTFCDYYNGVFSLFNYWTPVNDGSELQAVDINSDYLVATSSNGYAYIKKIGNNVLYPSKTITITRDEGIWGAGFRAWTDGIIYSNISLGDGNLYIGAPTTGSFASWQIPLGN